MKRVIIIFLTLTLLSHKQADNNFTEVSLEGKRYLISKISCETAPNFRRLAYLNGLNKISESVSDSTEIISAETILKDELSAFMLSKLDTASKYYKADYAEYKDSYSIIKDHTRQVRTLISDGKKYMYVNLFCELPQLIESKKIYLNSWLKAHDGGECFWQIIVNLTDKKIKYASHNGVA